jgi:cytochrome c556
LKTTLPLTRDNQSVDLLFHTAETAEFAAAHDKFWEMHDLIFENQNSLSEQMLGELAHRLTLDRQALRDALTEVGHLCRACAGGLFQRRAQRGKRYTNIFYQ